MGRRPDGPGATWETFPHTDKLHTDLPRVVQGKSPHIPQGKGVPVGRIATQTRHRGSDTSFVISLGVCESEDEKSSQLLARGQCTLPRVGRASARDPHTKDTGKETMGTERRFP